MKNKIKKYIKEILTFIVFISIFANVISLYKSQDLNKQALSQVNLTLIDDSKYKFPTDKPILIHFWATWCPICKVEAPNIQLISNHYEVLTIAVKSGSDITIEEYMKDKELTYKTYNDDEGFLSSEFNIPAYPTTFIYNKKGELVFSEVGYTSTFGLWIRMLWAGWS